MGICPNCGDWVDEGDICMSCGGGSVGSADDFCDAFGGSGCGYSPSPQNLEERQKSDMKWEWKSYESSLQSARKEDNYKFRLKHYNNALEHVRKYWNTSKRCGMNPCPMPDRSNPLPDIDVEWLKKRHYISLSKGLFKNDEKDALEEFLERSGYADVITENKSRYAEYCKASAASFRIERAKILRKDYFKHIEKANAAVDEDKLKKAMKEYRKAQTCWINYFHYDYKNDFHRDKMPEGKFTSHTVEHMMVIYVKTHPLLTSKKKKLDINREIVEMLDGKWENHIEDADRKAQEIYDEKQKKKQELLNVASDVVAGAMIVGDRIFSRIKR